MDEVDHAWRKIAFREEREDAREVSDLARTVWRRTCFRTPRQGQEPERHHRVEVERTIAAQTPIGCRNATQSSPRRRFRDSVP
jgi:hypothetical protein